MLAVAEKCGVAGVYSFNGSQASPDIFLSLAALQYRGQDSAGMATYDDDFHLIKNMGLVTDVFHDRELSRLRGNIGIGHTRYATEGSSNLLNAQPLVVETGRYKIAFGFNGNVPHYNRLRTKLMGRGFKPTTTTDAEGLAFAILGHLENTDGDLFEANARVMEEIPGAYSYTALILDKQTNKCQLVGGRDGLAFRPLSYGTVDSRVIIASETMALDQFGKITTSELGGGEVIVVNENGPDVKKVITRPVRRGCEFEDLYFSSPASMREGKFIYMIREALGEILAEMYPVSADVVLGLPDSGIYGAVGYSRKSGIPTLEAILKNRFIPRTFIMPDQAQRERAVDLKFFYMPSLLEGKDVVLIDDTVVRNTTMTRAVQGLRQKGRVNKVHVRVTGPPIVHLCDWGIAFRTSGELVASKDFRDNSFENLQEINRQMAVKVGADSFGYMSIEGLLRATGRTENTACTTCFTGKLPYVITTY